jgi:chromosome segregation ATPase
VLLSASFFSVVREYIGILLFICLPVIVLSALLAIWLHYRQKRRKANTDNIANEDTDASLISFAGPASITAVSPLEMEDRIGLAKECRKQLSKSRAKYVALKHDFSVIQKHIVTIENNLPENNGHMENLNEKIAAYEKQITDLQSKLEVLETVVPVQDETYYLRQALREKDNETAQLKQRIAELESGNWPAAATDEPGTIAYKPSMENADLLRRIDHLQNDKAELDRKIKEQDYLKDMYAESKLQVEFLQNQLESRIKNHSETEQKNRELSSSLHEKTEQLRATEGKTIFLNQQMESKQHELEQTQFNADQKDSELHRMREELQLRNSQVSHLEGLLAELKEQNSILNVSFGEGQNSISHLKEQLAGEQQHSHHLEDKLLKNRQLLERIYRDVESSILSPAESTELQAVVKPMY